MAFNSSTLLIAFALCSVLASCKSSDEPAIPNDATASAEETTQPVRKTAHSYGGWYCPDNLNGFPPVNLTELDQVPVVNRRLPTEEEARNGTSLMYFNTVELPQAEALDMTLPRMARYWSNNTHKRSW